MPEPRGEHQAKDMVRKQRPSVRANDVKDGEGQELEQALAGWEQKQPQEAGSSAAAAWNVLNSQRVLAAAGSESTVAPFLHQSGGAVNQAAPSRISCIVRRLALLWLAP